MQPSNNAPTTMPPDQPNPNAGIFVCEDPLDRSKCWLRNQQVVITFPDFPDKGLVLESEHLFRLLEAMAPFEGVVMRVIPPDVLRRHDVSAPFGIAFLRGSKPTFVYLATQLTSALVRRFFEGFRLVPIVVGIRGTAGNGDILKHANGAQDVKSS